MKIEISDEAWVVILRGLGELPFRMSAPVIQYLQQQRKIAEEQEKKEKVDNG